MTFAIKFGDNTDSTSVSGFIYFDAVLNYKQSIGGTVTKHPLDNGSSISDHFISNNIRHTFTAVISFSDFLGITSGIYSGDPNTDDTAESPLNWDEQATAVQVNDLTKGLAKYIPDLINQFLQQETPTPVFDSNVRTDKSSEIISLIKKLIIGYPDSNTGSLVKQSPVVTFYEYDGTTIFNQTENCVLTQFDRNESPENGDALYIDVTLEEVRFVELKKTTIITKKSSKKTAKKTATTSDQGTVQSQAVLPDNSGKNNATVETVLREK